MKKNDGSTFLIVLVIVLIVAAVLYLFVFNKKQFVETAQSPSPSASVISKSKLAAMPLEISELFNNLNNSLSTNFVPEENSEFYSLNGYIAKKSWTLDFTSAVKDKSQIVMVKELLEKELKVDSSSSAAGPGQTVEAYDGKEIRCYLLLGLNKKDIINCSTK